ncbi:MAG: 4-hydroxy-tetrahydrodipicolinate reductase [Pseudomonadota bacterium]
MPTVKIAVLGASGRMGRSLREQIEDDPELKLSGAWQRSAASNSGPQLISNELSVALAGADIAVDFSLAAAQADVLSHCLALKMPLVCGVTGLNAVDLERLGRAAKEIPLLYDTNMSAGVHVLAELVRRAASLLGDSYDAEVFEAHHRRKLDAPSGTAIKLGEAVAEGHGTELSEKAVWSRHNASCARAPGEIGFSVVRGGDIVGEHTVYLAGTSERLELTHRAQSRSVFSAGALRAAKWLVGQPAGSLYTMGDALNLTS